MEINKDIERRNFTHEVRAKKESREVEGTATTFNQFYDLGWYEEMIDSRAFDNIINSSDLDTIAVFNHNWDMPLARSSSGTLKLELNSDSLVYKFEAPNTTLGNDLIEMLSRGDIKNSSFAFRVKKDMWETIGEGANAKERRTILEISELIDVSPVTFPANPNTEVALRMRDAAKPEPPKPDPEPVEDYQISLREKQIRINKLRN